MNTNTRRVSLLLALIVVALIASFYLGRTYIEQQNKKVISFVNETLVQHNENLLELSELTRTNGADSATDKIIIDCKADERQRFDVLLDLLSSTITAKELQELDTLFYKCGGFYADRKAVMATRLTREVEQLEYLLSLKAEVAPVEESEDRALIVWEEIAASELQMAQYFAKLVALQGNIIAELLSGQTASAPSIVATLSEVSTVRGQMLILSKQIEVRKTEVQ